MNYIYNLKHVTTEEEYVEAVEKGYVDINYPKELEENISRLLILNKNRNDEFKFLYSTILMDEDHEEEAVEILKQLIREKNPQALHYLGKYYYDKNKDLKKGIKYIKKAAKLNYVPAFNTLGLIHLNDKAGSTFEESVKWFRLAAEQGFALAQSNLAVMLEGGVGVAKNLEEAKKWYTLAADQGLSVAIEALKKF